MSVEAARRQRPAWLPVTGSRLNVIVLAVLAYVPALLSSPGRMPADTKLYLYTEPGGLLGRAASTFEPDQFAGWVPHQQITYLWPSGPWFWVFDSLSVPDWVAHRLWIGTIFFAAGVGVMRCARLLGHAGVAGLAAAAVYQTSPYILAYVSRTSLLLLPWAGLGWIVAATIRATVNKGRQDTWVARWREPAIIALIVATVGSTNAAALAMIAPAPLIWLGLAVAQRTLSLRRAAVVGLRVGATCTATALWWMAMLVTQSRHGAPVLLYSETLDDVSRNSTGPEVLRGLGYWLFYGRDAFGATTAASFDYLTRTRAILLSFLIPIIGLAGIGFGRSAHRRFAALLAVVGMVLSVGVHPIRSSSPLVTLLTGDSETGLALALRSSTRAVPVLVLGLALGTAALVERVPRRFSMPGLSVALPARRLASAIIIVAAVANLPSLWRTQLVDSGIDRQQDLPSAWVEAGRQLDVDAAGHRVLQLPGSEFGAFDWGYTVDQPAISVTDRGLVTRDLLPLGSAQAMDLLYAFDDRIQTGVLEPASIAPVSRLFGASTIWVANDLESLRFRTPPAATVDAVVDGAPGLGAEVEFGEPSVRTTTNGVDSFGRDLVDADSIGVGAATLAPVALVDVEDPLAITRVKTDEAIVSGSGDGIVDAAAAGLIDGSELLRYGVDVDWIDPDDVVIVTDSNRDRGHHWRSSQDVVGQTESGGPGTDVLDTTAADQRLDPLHTDDDDAQTIALQVGPVTAVASAYGEPFAYRPEDRAVMAIDGKTDTAWSVGDHGDPVSAALRLTVAEPIGSMVLHQIPAALGGRQIASVDIISEAGLTQVDLDDASTDGSGQLVDFGAAVSGDVIVIITAVTTGDPELQVSRAGVGFIEVETGLASTVEYIRPPVETLQRLGSDHEALDIVFTRERVAGTSFWRADPEPRLQRSLPLSHAADFDVSVLIRLDHRLTDAQLASVIGDEGAVANRRLPGLDHRGAAAVDGDATTAWLTPIDDAIGAALTVTNIGATLTSLDIVQPIGKWSTISEIVVAGSGGETTVAVPLPDVEGRVVVAVPSGLVTADAPATITITRIRPTTVIERRYGDVITMPAGIAELTGTTGIEAAPVASDRLIDRSCDANDSTALVTVDEQPLPLQFSTTVGALVAGEGVLASACTSAVALEPGDHTIVEDAGGSGFTVDRIVMSTEPGTPQPQVADAASGTVDTVDTGTRGATVDVDCPDGCWLVYGMGYNTAWRASGLGEPSVVDGGFNGWWIEPTTGTRRIDIEWTAQSLVTFALLLSILAILACLGVVLMNLRQRESSIEPPLPFRSNTHPPTWSTRQSRIVVAAGALAVGLTVSPVWGCITLAVCAADVGLRRQRRVVPVVAITGLVGSVVVACTVVITARRDRPYPGAGWTTAFDHLNGAAITALALVALSTFFDPQRSVLDRDEFVEQLVTEDLRPGLDEESIKRADEPESP